VQGTVALLSLFSLALSITKNYAAIFEQYLTDGFGYHKGR